MRVLIACEFSGVVRDAFLVHGHDAFSCDILPTESNRAYNRHYQGDVIDYIGAGWDLIIAHPPCTYLTNSGVRHLYDHVVSKNSKRASVYGEARFTAMRIAARFFNQMQSAPCPRICVENPIPHKYARELIGKYDQIIQPWQFGHGETKATCLWLKNLPPLKPTKVVEGREARIHKMPPSPDRAKNRSRTFQGIADAMAEQWGGL